ncbi:Anaphase-promoting complex subunit Apc14 [Schizosaccharomyces pombe]|uniref:Anaphase-promoting complex subunit 14 n=1 Tax=Schizosaccharomyces pombe (strain 972 / ATCC 24843) TaxID=284812 RepID=APC14_SCHPO|nr:anaphase-promoting complex subunit Apc14 [Schizosaccharomyces pombe]O42659.1 RecName: Full=Anaphase-promoting complex subunit 14; AltName: Full=20S cyclosome/APC complex protein apc14; AltName: Full=Overlapping meiotic transcript protein 1 [Schizosaccharomyces pombe 972h-]CAA15824.1 anaphase-promoting complex subunit Apc14 [Schizosaccharomyces pombe]|eukprot:NP_594611.1 anaphase-promoting complex subunit Apc14 [Schizosaccharomyces pombe]
MDPFAGTGQSKSYRTFGNVFQRLSMSGNPKPLAKKPLLLPEASKAIEFWNYRDVIGGEEAEQERNERASRIAISRIASSRSSIPEYRQAIMQHLTKHVQQLDQLAEW